MMTTFDVLTQLWNERSPAWLIILVATFIYTLAVLTYGVSRRQIAFFVASAGTFVLALASPLAALASRYLFSAHMMQHLLLLLIVPLFAMLAWPSSSAPASGDLLRGSDRGAIPLGWLAGVGAMWFWHIPALCTAAMQHSSVFAIQATSLVAAGAAFWWPIFRPRLGCRLPPYAAAVYLFSGCVGCSLLGIYIAFSPVSVCPLYAVGGGSPELTRLIHEQWGLTHRIDQQVGGLLMWVPACMVYLGAILATFSKWHQVPEPVLAPEGSR
jgi:cytochrome c oxidase assembly factor CtaG